ncbi:MAG: hypothetical protein WDN27_00895 [Candidatus Saccharibacteria bacterium]
MSYTITAAPGNLGSVVNGSNANAVPYVALSYGPPDTTVRSGINDTNYNAASSDSIIALTTLSAARSVTLPSASANLGKGADDQGRVGRMFADQYHHYHRYDRRRYELCIVDSVCQRPVV